MSKIDDKYIKALNIFTEALGEIVETLKAQKDTGKADVVNDLLTGASEKYSEISKSVQELHKTTKAGFEQLKSQNLDILERIKSINQQKESGMFDRVEDPKNKNKIVDGIKVVILIAAGVLAMGMAFKLIGKVDFLSVIALSGAILVMSVAFSKIADIKDLNYRKVLAISAILPIMAIGLALSGIILSKTPRFTIAQGISIFLISGALSIATYLLLHSISKLKTSQLLLAPLIPIIIPLIALGIVMASFILKGIQMLTLKEIISIALVGVALAISTYAIGLALKGMKDITWRELIVLPLMIPLIAGGIVMASWIFQGFAPIQDPLQLLIGSAVIGLSLLIFSIPIKVLGKMKIADLALGILAVVPLSMAIAKSSRVFQNFIPLREPLKIVISSLAIGISILLFSPAVLILGKMKVKDVVTGTIALPFVAIAIVLTAKIFNELPGNMRYPDFMWSLGAGLAMIVFAPVVWFASKLDNKKIAQSALAIPAIAGAILIAALIFSALPNNMRYPEYEWSLGVGLAMLVFAPVVYFASTLKTNQLLQSALAIPAVALMIRAVANIFQKLPDDMKYPDYRWTLGAGLAILAFGGMAIAVGLSLSGPQAIASALGLIGIILVAKTLVKTASILSKGDYSKYPSIDWIAIVGGTILGFGLLATELGATFVVAALGLVAILLISKTMVKTAEILSKGDYSKYPSVEWSIAVGGSLLAFSVAMVAASAAGLIGLVGRLFTGGKDPLVKMAQSMINVANKLNEVDWSSAQYPSLEYTLSIGGFLLTFATIFAAVSAVEGFNKIVSKLFGGGQSDSFTTFMVKAVDAMKYSNEQLGKVAWSNNHPSLEFAQSIGGLLVSFANVFASISRVEGLNKFFGGTSDNFTTFMVKAVDAMKYTNEQLGTVNWTGNYPSKEYAEGVGGLLEALANSFASISKTQGFGSIMAKLGVGSTNFTDFVKNAADSMIVLRNTLGEGNWDTSSFPKKEYAEGVGSLLISMAEAYSKLGGGGLFASIGKLLGEGNKQTLTDFIKEASNSIVIASNILVNGNFTTVPDKKWINNFSDVIIKYAELANRIDDEDLLESNKIILGLIQNMVSNVQALSIISDWNKVTIPTKDYINNFSYLLLEVNKIMNKVNGKLSQGFVDFTTTASKSLSQTSQILNDGKYDNFPSKNNIESFAYFILSMSDVVEKSKFDNLKSATFVNSTSLISTAINDWLQMMSTGNFNHAPSKIYTNDFKYYLLGLDDIVSNWKTTVEESDIFKESIKSVIESLSYLSNIQEDAAKNFSDVINKLKELPDISGLDTKAVSINRLAMSFSSLADSLAKVNSNLQGFGTLSKGLPLINVDDTNLLKTVDKYKASLTVVNESQSGQANLLDKLKGFFESAPEELKTIKTEDKKVIEDRTTELKQQQQFYTDISDIKNLLYQVKDSLDKPTQAGSFK